MCAYREIKQGNDYLGVKRPANLKKVSLSQNPNNKVWIEEEVNESGTIYRKFQLAKQSSHSGLFMSINCLCQNSVDNKSIGIQLIKSESICACCRKDTTLFIKENSSRDDQYRLKHACNDRYVSFTYAMKEKKLKLDRQEEDAQVWNINEVP